MLGLLEFAGPIGAKFRKNGNQEISIAREESSGVLVRLASKTWLRWLLIGATAAIFTAGQVIDTSVWSSMDGWRKIVADWYWLAGLLTAGSEVVLESATVASNKRLDIERRAGAHRILQRFHERHQDVAMEVSMGSWREDTIEKFENSVLETTRDALEYIGVPSPRICLYYAGIKEDKDQIRPAETPEPAALLLQVNVPSYEGPKDLYRIGAEGNTAAEEADAVALRAAYLASRATAVRRAKRKRIDQGGRHWEVAIRCPVRLKSRRWGLLTADTRDKNWNPDPASEQILVTAAILLATAKAFQDFATSADESDDDVMELLDDVFYGFDFDDIADEFKGQ